MLYRRLIENNLDTGRRSDSERIVLSDGIMHMTFRQIHVKTARYCALFQEKGIQSGERILIIDYNLMDTVAAILACIAMGIIFVPLGNKLDEKTKNYIIQDCRPAMVLDKNIQLGQTVLDMKMRQIQNKDTLVYIIYTSGSEGIPKGVVASQKQIFFCCEKINQRLNQTETDRIFCCLPLSFDYGLYQVFLSFFSGAVLFLDRGNVLQKIPYMVKHWQITGLPLIPSIANAMIRAGLYEGMGKLNLRYITFTGEVLPAGIIKSLKHLCPKVQIVPMYGLTECKRVSIMPMGREDKINAGSCGLPLDGVNVWLEKSDNADDIGELVVEGPNVMEGYWGIGDKDTGVFFQDEKRKKRTVHTGDIFRIDEDGFLYFCERKGDIIKMRGHRIGGNWIETQMREIEGIREIKVFGIPDKNVGERLIIAIYVESRSVQEQIAQKMKELPYYLHKYEIYLFHKRLPKSANGKIDKNRLIQLVEERGHEVPWK